MTEQNDDLKTKAADALERVTRAMLKASVDAGKAKPDEFEIVREDDEVFIRDNKSGLTSRVVNEAPKSPKKTDDGPKMNRADRRKMEKHWRRIGKKR